MSPALIYSLGEVRGKGKARFPQRSDIGQLKIRDPLLQPLDQSIDVGTGPAIAAFQILGIDVSMGDDGDGFGDVIEDHHAVIERETEVGQLAIIRRRAGEVLHIANGVIPGIAHRSARKSRQTSDRGSAIGSELFFEQLERIVVRQFQGLLGSLAAPGRPGVQPHALAKRLEAQKGSGTGKAVASHAFAADDALEEKRPVPLLNLAKRADGSQGIADELAIHRHQISFASQSGEFRKRREVTHPELRHDRANQWVCLRSQAIREQARKHERTFADLEFS
jgi:hypothetical protein